ncbi:tail fiber domain-containing protein [Pseudomonas saponiphila]|uniref:Chaperone of endosialidase n=1 Tax=Pseudomonas saponiphila TaxID=556534 RepID=A0A1H4XLK9_9PSED|nr:tail fiber domain-containing protein [Pseudomonas saponiphila]SED05614.1 Chaperone of endosialidase [Pseudomonas saponiphila]
MTIDPIHLGSAPNDGTGQNLRSGGQTINDNFAELDIRTGAAQTKADQGVADAANALSAANSAQTKADQGVADAANALSAANAAQTKADQGVADAENAREIANGKLSISGGSLSGPLLSSSHGKFTQLELSSTTEALISGGEPHTAVTLGPIISIAKNTNMITEFFVSSEVRGYAPKFTLLRSRGTVSAPTAVIDADNLGAFQFVAHNGSFFITTASISAAIDGTPSGAVVPTSLQLYTAGANTGGVRWRVRSSGDFQPGDDNLYDIGGAGVRPKTLWAATGAISTSDAREKTVVRGLSKEEVGAAKALAKEIGSYRWLAAIAEKGESARDHIGMTVQRAIQVMSSFGLDPFAYGFICHDAWEERIQAGPVEGEDPTVVPAGDRYSFRIDELNLFLAAGFEARLAEIESRFA